MDTHAQSAMHKLEASIAGLVIMMRVVIGEMVFVPGLASTALHAQTRPWTFPAGRAKCTYSAKQTPRPSGASSPATHAAPGLSAKRKTPPVLLDEFAEPVEAEPEKPSVLKTVLLENPGTAILETGANLLSQGVALPLAGLVMPDERTGCHGHQRPTTSFGGKCEGSL